MDLLRGEWPIHNLGIAHTGMNNFRDGTGSMREKQGLCFKGGKRVDGTMK